MLAALCLAAPAAAQDGSEGAVERTPAGAQRFLNAIAERGQLLIARHFNYDQQFGVKVQSLVFEGDCSSRVDGQYYAYDSHKGRGYFDKSEDKDFVDSFFGKMGRPKIPFVIDWKNMGEIVATSHPVEPSLYRDQGKLYVTINGLSWKFPDEQTAKRGEFAMRYIVEKCGIASDEGF